MEKYIILALLLLTGCAANTGSMMPHSAISPNVTKKDYRIYDRSGKPLEFKALVADALAADVILAGEAHNDPAAHFLETEILKHLYGKDGRPLVLAMEMFEKDVQPVVNEYLADLITERHFLAATRAWFNYRTDYRPMLEFAKEKGVQVIGSNAPGRYVNRVSRLGRNALDALPEVAKSLLPPLPYGETSAACREKFRKFRDETEKDQAVLLARIRKENSGHPPIPPDMVHQKFDFENLLAAQTLRDAAMAYSISEILAKTPGARVFHVNGQFHSADGLGIPEHLARYRPGVRILTITILPEDTFPEFGKKSANAGDYIILANPELHYPDRPGLSPFLYR